MAACSYILILLHGTLLCWVAPAIFASMYSVQVRVVQTDGLKDDGSVTPWFVTEDDALFFVVKRLRDGHGSKASLGFKRVAGSSKRVVPTAREVTIEGLQLVDTLTLEVRACSLCPIHTSTRVSCCDGVVS